MTIRATLGACVLGLLLPATALAFPFGGQTSLVLPCFNGVIWALVGPPIGGAFIWVPGATQTYRNGPPAHSGQYLLGLAGPPYYCLVSILPLITVPGIVMIMEGSSQ